MEKICNKCSEPKPPSSFRKVRVARFKSRHGSPAQTRRHRSECWECERKLKQQLAEAHKSAPLKPHKCDCCFKVTEILIVDHDHETGFFRGWICRNCNQGIGKLGDDIEGLSKALDYLKGTLAQ